MRDIGSHDAIFLALSNRKLIMRNLTISKQLILLVGGFMLALALMSFLSVQSKMTSIADERYDMLRTQVESSISILDAYNERVIAGELTLEDAKTQAYDILTHIKYEPAGYMFGFDYDSVSETSA